MKIVKEDVREYFNKLPLTEAVAEYARVKPNLTSDSRIQVLESLAIRKTEELARQGKVMSLEEAAVELKRRYEEGIYDE